MAGWQKKSFMSSQAALVLSKYLLFSMLLPVKSKDAFASGIAYLLIVVFGLDCLVLSLKNPSIWFDDAYSLAMIRHSWRDILTITGKDFHPPLYYLILKFFSLWGGENVVLMKLVSTLPSVLTLVAGVGFLTRERDGKTAVILPLCFLASQTILHYSIEIRMYSWALFFVFASSLSAYYAVKTNKNSWYLIFTFFMLATFYTQYYAGIVVGIGYLFLLVYTLKFNRERIGTLSLIFLVTTLLYLPWLLVVLRQVANASADFWIPPLTILDVFRYLGTLFFTGNYLTSFLLLLLFAGVFLHWVFKKTKTLEDWFLFAGLRSIGGLVVFGVVLSICFRPIFISRYMVPVCGLVWLFFAGEIGAFLRNKLSFTLIVIFLLGCGCVSNGLSAQDGGAGFTLFKEYLSKEIRPDDVLVLTSPEYSGQLIGVVSYLFPSHSMAITERDAYRWENRTLDYADGPFAMKIITYKDLLKTNGTRKWFIVPFESSISNYKSFIVGKSVKFCGDYEWSTYQSGYQFRLYRID